MPDTLATLLEPTVEVPVFGGSMAEPTRVYVDMVGDLFHPGHVELLRAAREFGDELVVGVLSDETVAAYKRRPIMTLAERVAVIGACRFVEEVIPDSPYRVTKDFLDEHRLALVVHGDDLPGEGVADVYGEVQQAGLLRMVPRAGDISTTALIQRIRTRPDS
jgi:cytidyltransferase-like protein